MHRVCFVLWTAFFFIFRNLSHCGLTLHPDSPLWTVTCLSRAGPGPVPAAGGVPRAPGTAERVVVCHGRERCAERSLPGATLPAQRAPAARPSPATAGAGLSRRGTSGSVCRDPHGAASRCCVAAPQLPHSACEGYASSHESGCACSLHATARRALEHWLRSPGGCGLPREREALRRSRASGDICRALPEQPRRAGGRAARGPCGATRGWRTPRPADREKNRD